MMRVIQLSKWPMPRTKSGSDTENRRRFYIQLSKFGDRQSLWIGLYFIEFNITTFKNPSVGQKLFLLLLLFLPTISFAQGDVIFSKNAKVTSDSIPERPDSTLGDFLITSKIQLIQWDLWDPCKNQSVPFTYQQTCPTNPFHCYICNKRYKKNEALVYTIFYVDSTTTKADFAHLRCALKRIKYSKQ